ncbi:MAG: nitrous oxide reductase family maturation protein NosD [Romboutsia sp.]|nr:nitrous oxide reductase family maturation protein NosD [Romboutsia sp.]
MKRLIPNIIKLYIKSIGFVLLINSSLIGRDIIVSQTGKISKISEGIRIAEKNDRVIVRGGYYREYNLIINKEIILEGQDNPVIDCMMKDKGILIKSNNVTVRGFQIENIGVSNIDELAGVKVYESKNCLIEKNHLVNNFFGIYLANASGCIVRNNIIEGNSVTESSSGNGIHLWRCDSIRVDNNYISGHRDGIYFEFAGNSVINGNVSFLNLRYGLHFMFSHRNIYSGNTFRNNGAGVAVMYTNYVEMYNNRFEENWGNSSYGILLKDINDSKIFGNYFDKNTIAIFMEGSNRMEIKDNDFMNNGWAFKIMGNCYDGRITGNNFIGNTFDVVTNSSKNMNYFSGNYWDKYSGYDMDKDGIGDVSFRPVSIYSVITEKVPSGKILIRSFIMNILDAAEKVVPILIPESLIDDKPLMRRIQR